MSTTCNINPCPFLLRQLTKTYISGVECPSAITTRAPCIVPTATSASTCISILPPNSLHAHTTRKASVRSDLAAARSTFAKRSANSTLPVSVPMGDSVRQVRIQDGRKTLPSQRSRLKGVQRIWRRRGKESEKRGRERKRENGRGERVTGGMGEGEERGDTANGEGVDTIGEWRKRSVKGHHHHTQQYHILRPWAHANYNR